MKCPQIYEHNDTREQVTFMLQRPGVYLREDGKEFNVVKLRMYHKWVRSESRPGYVQKFVETPNGFKVRTK